MKTARNLPTFRVLLPSANGLALQRCRLIDVLPGGVLRVQRTELSSKTVITITRIGAVCPDDRHIIYCMLAKTGAVDRNGDMLEWESDAAPCELIEGVPQSRTCLAEKLSLTEFMRRK